MTMQRDADFLLAVLEESRGGWVSQMEIVRRSEQVRGCGITVHSRASDLRSRGLRVENKVKRSPTGRAVSFYRLLSEPAVERLSPPFPDALTSKAAGSESRLFETPHPRELYG